MCRWRSDETVLLVAWIDQTRGFSVSDSVGRRVGRVECPMYGTKPDAPDAVAVISDGWLHRHFVVPATHIRDVDASTGEIVLTSRRRELRRFL